MKHQSISLLGRRSSNEDEIDIVFNYENEMKHVNEMNYFAVYDGHGGNSMSKYIKDRLSRYFVDSRVTKVTSKSKTYNKYIMKVYNCMQEKVSQLTLTSKFCGSTALVVMQYKKLNVFSQLKIINLGDCRAVLCNEDNIAIPLTKDHKPMSWDENKRIIALDGNITIDKGDDPRINGLSVSRAFGDVEAQPHVTHIPDIYDYELNVSQGMICDKFIILGCDGIWDVLSNQDAVDFVLYRLSELRNIENTDKSNKKNIANLLGKYAINEGSGDNISVVILFL